MIKYCSNFKCKLWVPLKDDSTVRIRSFPDIGPINTRIVGRCTCCGAASGDCLRCGVQ